MLLTFNSLQHCQLNPVRYIGFSPRYSTPSIDADEFTPRQLRFVVFDFCHPDASDINLLAYNDQTLGGLTTTPPLMIHEIASVRQHRHNDSATVRLHRPRHTRTSFGTLTRDMQDYDFKARFESLPNSMNRLDTRGLLTRL
jgi:hypothetical protein